jgi:hypothetical protein
MHVLHGCFVARCLLVQCITDFDFAPLIFDFAPLTSVENSFCDFTLLCIRQKRSSVRSGCYFPLPVSKSVSGKEKNSLPPSSWTDILHSDQS